MSVKHREDSLAAMRQGQVMPAPREAKLAELARRAELELKAGADVMDYHMALEAGDLTYLQQANTVAHIEAQMKGLAADAPVGKLKEKWHGEDGTRTRLHEGIPLNVHDSVLAHAALLAAEIMTKQERLMQAVYDAATDEEAEAVTWD